jgi:SPP1 family predicted phage head-tail adaptor
VKCCEIDSGKLRHKIKIQRENLTDDGYGGSTVLWVDRLEARAWIKPTSGTEQNFGMQTQDTVTHDIVIRYSSTEILAKDSVLFETRRFNIRSVINVEERNRWLQLRCEEGVGN